MAATSSTSAPTLPSLDPHYPLGSTGQLSQSPGAIVFIAIVCLLAVITVAGLVQLLRTHRDTENELVDIGARMASSAGSNEGEDDDDSEDEKDQLFSAGQDFPPLVDYASVAHWVCSSHHTFMTQTRMTKNQHCVCSVLMKL